MRGLLFAPSNKKSGASWRDAICSTIREATHRPGVCAGHGDLIYQLWKEDWLEDKPATLDENDGFVNLL
jgi:hypothetical protein